jgi:hypothetical protein
MTLDFPAINRALAAAFGPGVVECLPSDEADYVLQFSRGETEAERRKAADIVGKHQGKRWYFSRIRRVESK